MKTDSAAQETLARVQSHLTANGVDIRQSRLTVGPTLKFDPQAQRFVSDSPANELTGRRYREGFVVPTEV